MKEDSLLITNIQRFSLHDGPGIRTTVFLKGCSLHCPWCCNPENISPEIQKYVKDGKEGVFGRYIAPDELLTEVLKDKDFYGEYSGEYKGLDELPGGVTFSGGEPLLQMQRLVPICEKLHEEKVHIAVETALFVPRDYLKLAYEHIDFFYVDVKILEAERTRRIEGEELDLYLKNLEWLMSRKQVKPTVLRVPVIIRYTEDIKNRLAVKRILIENKSRINRVELLKGHNEGKGKNRELGLSIPSYSIPADELMDEYRRDLAETGIDIMVRTI